MDSRDDIVSRFNKGVDYEALFSKDVALSFCVLKALEGADGRENAIPRIELLRKVRAIWKWKVTAFYDDPLPSDRVVRNAIRQLRKEGALILSTGGEGGGYWKASSLNEVVEFVRLEYRAKALDMLHTGARMIRSAMREDAGQLGLFNDPALQRLGEINEAISALKR